MDKPEHINSIVALPGKHNSLGTVRNGHFLIVPVWILNGIRYATFIAANEE